MRSSGPVVSAAVAEADDLLVRLGQMRASLVLLMAQGAALLVARCAWTEFGYRHQEDYARERLRRGGRWLRNLSALQRCFQRFPVLGLATAGLDEQPAIGRSAALAIGRAATENDIVERIRRERATPGSGSDAVQDASGDTNTVVPLETSEIRTPVRVEMPPEIRVALDEVLALHRAVSGQQVGYGSLMEALVADAVAGGWQPPTVQRESRPAASSRRQEGERRRLVGAPHAHGGAHASGRAPMQARRRTTIRSQIPAARRAHELLARCADIARRVTRLARMLGDRNEPTRSSANAGESPQRSRRQQLAALECTVRKLILIEDEIEIRIAELLVVLAEARAWQSLGVRSLADYAQERLHMSRASAHRRVRLARGLRGLPRVRNAYEAGQIGACAAAWIVHQRQGHVGKPNEDAVRAWIEHAKNTTLKRLDDDERCVRQVDLLRRAHVATGRAVERAAVAAYVPSDGGEPPKAGSVSAHRVPTDAEWHASLLRKPGLAGARLAALGHTVLERVVARAALVPVGWRVVVDATLAHQFIACAHTAALSLRLRAECSEARSVAEDARSGPALRIARVFTERGQSVPTWVGVLALLEEYARTWDDPAGMARSASDEICHRDGARCMAPGCTARRNLQVHHARYRSHGGGNELSNLVLLCAFHHHRGEHGGLARCRGTAPLGLTWRLGTSELATWFRNERRIDVSGI